ncbi:MAG: hypothetical protein KME46_29365 [Brasilonema angustatum HA4187-MV1]|jgi:hypothetical protein|nr:hypothetical protein [Brasilonema angustatum HA4187-MV1]
MWVSTMIKIGRSPTAELRLTLLAAAASASPFFAQRLGSKRVKIQQLMPTDRLAIRLYASVALRNRPNNRGEALSRQLCTGYFPRKRAAPKNPIAFICLPIAYVSYQVSHQP